MVSQYMDKTKLETWGNVSVSESYLREPETIHDLRNIIESVGERGCIPRGLGMSYGDQPMNSSGDVIRPSFSRKKIEYISTSGLVTVSSSATFAELLEQ